jgi:large subunit ribosomal protein L9
MPKTEVILIENVVGLGAESDQVKVAAGYARNYLIPHGLAIPMTGANKKRLEALQKRRGEREAHELNSMTELAKGLSKLTLTITVKTGEDGKMFGSVTAGTIADELHKQYEAAVEKKKIHLKEPIKAVGDYDVELKLHADVPATLKVKVISSTPPPAPVAAPAKDAAKDARGAAAAGGRPERPERRTPKKTADKAAAEKP